MITKQSTSFGAGARTLASAILLACAVSAGAAADHAGGRILVETRAGLPDAALQRILDEHGGGRARRLGASNLFVVALPSAGHEEALVRRLAAHPHLKAAELDRRLSPLFAVNDPYAGSEWHLTKVGAPAAWDAAQGAGVTVAVLDSGVDASHPDLAARLVAGWNAYDNNADTTDVYGHGTMVAGTAAAIGNNGIGVAGVAPQAAIMPVRVTDTAGYGYISAISQGLTWAADHGAKVANLSFAGVAGSSSILSAASYMKSRGGLVVAAAGNSGAFDATPSTTALIPVSATDVNDALASFSSWGSYVALAAPGTNIYTTTRGGGYASVNGTSFSSPLTAGVVALMMSARPALANTQVESLLYGSALDLGAAGRDGSFGYGRVDAWAAVQAALAATPISSDTQPPSAALTSPASGSVVAGLVTVGVGAADNVGVTKLQLRANGALVATDTSAPYGFTWDSTTVSDGEASLQVVAFDAAGNSAASAVVAVTVANQAAADTTPPKVTIASPLAGSTLADSSTVSASATDDRGSAGLRLVLKIDGVQVARATGGSLSYRWNTRKLAAGPHSVQVTATDAAGNAGQQAVQVTR